MRQTQRAPSSVEYINTASKRDWNWKRDLKGNAVVTLKAVFYSMKKSSQKRTNGSSN